MPIVKCQNPECDYFQKPVPEGDFCPFCGEPLGSQPSLSSGFPPPRGPSQPTYPPQVQPAPYPPVIQTPPPQVQPAPYPPVVQTPVSPPQATPPYPPVVQTPIPPTKPIEPVLSPYPPVSSLPATPVVHPNPVYPPTVEPETPSIPAGIGDPGATMYESPRSVLKLVHSLGREFTVIPGQKAYLGRRGGQKKPHPEIDLTDIPYSERISRPHAHIFWDETAKSYMIVDNQSANGTMINGEVLQPWRPYSLQNGSILELGKEHHIKFNVLIR